MKSPAFQLYASDYLSDPKVQLLSLEEEGAYIRLLCYCWQEGSIPSDEALLSRLCKGASNKIIRVVKALFKQHPVDDSKLIHLRLDKERVKQSEWRKKSSEGGKRGAEKRWGKDRSGISNGIGVVKPEDVQCSEGGIALQSSVFSLQTSVITPTSPEDGRGGIVSRRDFEKEFDEFWDYYPEHRKTNRYRAQSAWSEMRHQLPHHSELMHALKAFKNSHEWKKENGKMVPGPHAWLLEKRWGDAPAYKKPSAPILVSAPCLPVVDEDHAISWFRDEYEGGEIDGIPISEYNRPFRMWHHLAQKAYLDHLKNLQLQ